MNFYVLKPDGGIRFGTKWAYADQIDPVHRGEGEKCPVCRGPVGGLSWLPPHRIKLSTANPRKWGDFLWGAGFGLMVSDRFRGVYEAEGLTGITVFHPPAEIVRVGRGKTGNLPPSLPKYRLVEIPWGSANQNDLASEVVWERAATCSYCRFGHSRRQQKIVIEEASWTGVDLFVARGAPLEFLVSERFRRVAESHGLRNAWFIPAERYAYDDHRPGSMWYVRE